MKKSDLEFILRDKRVPPWMYSLNGLKDGECYCVINNGNKWNVVYMERGTVDDIATELTEEEAYDVVYEKFKEAYGWE